MWGCLGRIELALPRNAPVQRVRQSIVNDLMQHAISCLPFASKLIIVNSLPKEHKQSRWYEVQVPVVRL